MKLVLDRVPPWLSRVLIIGSDVLRLGHELKRRLDAFVIGIESDSAAAEVVRPALDAIIAVDADGLHAGFDDRSFGVVIWQQGFECVRERLPMLRRIHKWLPPDGRLLLTCPNVRRHGAVASLLAGRWPLGQPPRSQSKPLRWYTGREVEKLLFRAGFDILETRPVPGDGYDEWEQAGWPRNIRAGSLQVTAASTADAEELYSDAFLLTAQPRVRPEAGLTSIVIVTHNELAYTRRCVESIRLVTDESYELIFVDNASTDGTVGYLKSLCDVTLIENRENRGFPAAANQGIRAARGRQILLLNNDTLVTTGWLRRMLDALERDPAIGLLGPCSNNVSGPQQVPAGYDALEKLDGFAWDFGRAAEGRIEDETRLVGFCLLIRREVIETVGLLDESFGVGCFEDDDLCRRAIEAGWRCVIARDAFVHHFGSRTFLGSGVDLKAVLATNEDRYVAKWGTRPRLEHRPNGRERTERPRFKVVRGADGAPRLGTNDIGLSLCMICRNNETTIGPALESIRPYVDEMVVVDTGSTDRTPEICRELGARVFHFAWCDDFSAARNESIRHARGEWIFWMDSDDTIDAENGRKLRALAGTDHPPEVMGFVMQVHCPSPSEDGHMDYTAVDHLKMFRHRPDLRFEHRIHEQMIPAIRRASGEVAATDIFVVHSGSDHSAEGRQRKIDRDLRILRKDLAERPDHPFVLFNFGMTYNDIGLWDDAIRHLRRCIAVSKPEETHLRKAYAFLASALQQSKRVQDALAVCGDGLKLYVDDKELMFRSAMLCHELGRLEEAEQLYLRVLNEQESWHFSSVDRGLAGYKSRHNLARVYESMGHFDKAEEQWRQIVSVESDYRPAWRGLGESLLAQDKRAEFDGLVQQLLSCHSLRVTGLLLAALQAERSGNVQAAREHLEQAARESPENVEVLQELCRLLFERVDPLEAADVLERLATLRPDDASVQHNLGTLCRRRGDLEQAIVHYRRSLALRPDSESTRAELERAKRELHGADAIAQ